MSNSQDFKSYISQLNIASEDKTKAIGFFKKLNYLYFLKNTFVNIVHENVTEGYGNLNSKICFIFSSEEKYKIIKPLLEDYLNDIKLNLWDIYVTFYNKTKSKSSKELNYLMNEVNCINPSIIFIFDNDISHMNNLINEYKNHGLTLPEIIFIDLSKFASDNQKDKYDIRCNFIKLINYKQLFIE